METLKLILTIAGIMIVTVVILVALYSKKKCPDCGGTMIDDSIDFSKGSIDGTIIYKCKICNKEWI